MTRGGFGARGPEVHPCHLEEGVERFAGGKWDIYLAGLGLKQYKNLHQKTSGLSRATQVARFWLWRATRLWVIKV